MRAFVAFEDSRKTKKSLKCDSIKTNTTNFNGLNAS